MITTNSVLIHPEWLDAIGMVASSIAFAIAIYLQFFLKQRIRVRNTLGFVGIGFALFLLSVRADFVSNDALLYARAIGYFVFIGLEIAGLKAVLSEVKGQNEDS